MAQNLDTDPATAARTVRTIFNRHSDEIRAGVWNETGFPLPEAFDRAHAVAIIAGVGNGEAEAHMVAVMERGSATWIPLTVGAIKVLAPPPLGMDLPIELEPALEAESPSGAVGMIASTLRSSVGTMADLISDDLDATVVRSGEPRPQITYLAQPPSTADSA